MARQASVRAWFKLTTYINSYTTIICMHTHFFVKLIKLYIVTVVLDKDQIFNISDMVTIIFTLNKLPSNNCSTVIKITNYIAS